MVVLGLIFARHMTYLKVEIKDQELKIILRFVVSLDYMIPSLKKTRVVNMYICKHVCAHTQ